MRSDLTKTNTHQVEQAFLRKAWWFFPVAGALASLAVGGPFWAWVDGQWARPDWSQLVGVRAACWAVAFLVFPVLWRIGLRLQRPQRWIWPAVVGVVVAAEGLLSVPRLQTALWLAARVRLGGGQHFMREVCYVRLEETAGRSDHGSAVFLVGSSQVLAGLDQHMLATLQPRPVIRRAMFGMTPLKALSMRAYMPFRAGDRCVLYLSEFDFTNQDEFPFAWFRPYASWQTLPDVMRCVTWRVRVRHWRHVADYALAASTEWWRARDFIQQIAFHFREGGPAPGARSAVPDLAAAAAEKARGALTYSQGEFRGFRLFAQRFNEQGATLLILEGDVNPALYSEARMQAKRKAREYVAGLMAMGFGRYISMEEQALDLQAGDWADMTHLGATGREKLTRRVAQELSRP